MYVRCRGFVRCYSVVTVMDAFGQILSHYPYAMCGGAAAATVCAAGAFIRIATRKKPTHVSVNCWFCSMDTVVPYGNRNCWDCPNCEQYNGFQENGDYNKPIPAQYMEDLNHGISAGLVQAETTRPQQWVNCQMLLCKKCNHNQTLKIKQLASFLPRDEEKYDEEIEVYRHHLEQTYKLCRPCQTAVEYYIKHQNRQLRSLLASHQLRRVRDRDAHAGYVQSVQPISSPLRVVLLRVLAFVTCAFLVAVALYGQGNPLVPRRHPESQSGSATPHPDKENLSDPGSVTVLRELLDLMPGEALEKARLAWDYGRDHQMMFVSLGLLTCFSGVFLAGPVRLRRVDAMASVLWVLVLLLYLLDTYVDAMVPGWLATAKLGATAVCCLVGFAAAVATRKSTSQRRARGRRYLSGSSSSLGSCYNGCGQLLDTPISATCPSFVPTPPPNLSQLLSRHRGRRVWPSSLPARFSRALSLGTIPALAHTDSGCLFSGSRPTSQCKDSPPSDYFSLKSGSRPSSPGPSTAPSVAGSATSTSSAACQRRPLISPARLQLGGKKLRLFSPHVEAGSPATPHCPPEPSLFFSSSTLSPEAPPCSPYSHDLGSLLEDSSVFDKMEGRKKSSSSSSACLVDTTNGEELDNRNKCSGILGWCLWPGMLCASLTANLIFASVYCYHTWR